MLSVNFGDLLGLWCFMLKINVVIQPFGSKAKIILTNHLNTQEE